MKKLILTMMLFGLSLNIYAGQIGESQMAECTESVQSRRSQETVTESENSNSGQSQETQSSNDR